MFARLMGLDTISPTALYQLIQQNAVTVFDVNAKASWLRARIPTAIHLDPATIRAGDLPADQSARLVFYCANPMCRKAPNAAKQARKWGYANVQVLSAGIKGWLASELPTESGE